jgi:hypothetical protein
MEDFKPSDNFVARVMQDVRFCEAATGNERKHMESFLFSKPVFSILTAGGILLGVINLVRIASILISPAPCL